MTNPTTPDQGDERRAMLMALAQLRWLAFGECRTEGWEGAPPTAAETEKALTAALAQPVSAEAGKVEPVADEPFAYYVYVPAEQRGELVHGLDDAIDDLTNCECEVSKLYLRHTQQALSDAKGVARYRHIRSMAPKRLRIVDIETNTSFMEEHADEAIDAAILAAAGGSEK